MDTELNNNNNNIKSLDRSRTWMRRIGYGLFSGRAITQGLALVQQSNDENFFQDYSTENPLTYALWRGYNHSGSSMAVGVIGVSWFKSLMDPYGNGGILSDALAVLSTTSAYAVFEAFATRRPNTEFSIEDVAVTAITESITVLIDRMIRRSKGLQNGSSLYS